MARLCRRYSRVRQPAKPPARAGAARPAPGLRILPGMPSSRLPWLTSRLQGFGTTIFAEMTGLAIAHQAVNLGQGFPDFDGPEFIKRAAIDAIGAGHNQYCRTHGIPELNRAIAEHQKRFWSLDYDPDAEITVYSGATEAIYATLAALCEVGDEVILFEPYYDSYRASV